MAPTSPTLLVSQQERKTCVSLNEPKSINTTTIEMNPSARSTTSNNNSIFETTGLALEDENSAATSCDINFSQLTATEPKYDNDSSPNRDEEGDDGTQHTSNKTPTTTSSFIAENAAVSSPKHHSSVDVETTINSSTATTSCNSIQIPSFITDPSKSNPPPLHQQGSLISYLLPSTTSPHANLLEPHATIPSTHEDGLFLAFSEKNHSNDSTSLNCATNTCIEEVQLIQDSSELIFEKSTRRKTTHGLNITLLDDDTLGTILLFCGIPDFESLRISCRKFYHKFQLTYLFEGLLPATYIQSSASTSNLTSNGVSTFSDLGSSSSSIPSKLFPSFESEPMKHPSLSSIPKAASSPNVMNIHTPELPNNMSDLDHHLSPFLRHVLRNMFYPLIFVPIRCMHFNSYAEYKDAIMDYWVKQYGFKRLNESELKVELDFSKPIPWLDGLEKVLASPEQSESRERYREGVDDTIQNTISRKTKDCRPLLYYTGSKKRTTQHTNRFASNTTLGRGKIDDDTKSIQEKKNSGSILKQQVVANKFTDPNEFDGSDNRRSLVNSARSLVVANHWKIFQKFELHVDFQFPSHERNFSFVEMPEITMYYHNFRTSDGNPKKDLIEISTGSIYKNGVDGKVYEFDPAIDVDDDSNSTPSDSSSFLTGLAQDLRNGKQISAPSDLQNFLNLANYDETPTFDYDVAKVAKVLLFFILHDFVPRFFSDYFSPKIAALESKSQQNNLEHLMNKIEKADQELVVDYVCINRNQLRDYRNKTIKKHTKRFPRRQCIKENCLSMVRNFTKTIPFVNYNQMTYDQKCSMIRTFLLNHVNKDDFSTTNVRENELMYLSSSFSGFTFPDTSYSDPYHILKERRLCQAREEPRQRPTHFYNSRVDNKKRSSNAEEIPYDVFSLFFDTIQSAETRFLAPAVDVADDKKIMQRHIIEIPTDFSLRWITYKTPKNFRYQTEDISESETRPVDKLKQKMKNLFKLFMFCSDKHNE